MKIDPAVQSLLRPLSVAERALLEANIIAEGRVRDPLVVWDERDVLVDGHHRYAIAIAHDIPFTVYRRPFADFDAVREWVSLNPAPTPRRRRSPIGGYECPNPIVPSSGRANALRV